MSRAFRCLSAQDVLECLLDVGRFATTTSSSTSQRGTQTAVEIPLHDTLAIAN